MFRTSGHRRSPGRASVRPAIEALEARDVPAAHAGVGAAAAAAADHPAVVTAFEDGETVLFKMNNEHVTGVDHGALEEKVAVALYAFGIPGSQLQPDVLSLAPGDSGYRPWWEVFQVTVNDGRDLSTNPFTSEEEILEAAATGAVTIRETDFIFLC